MYQILKHALGDSSNKTRFTLVFANIAEKDILLREEFEAMRKQHPDTFNIVYTLDQAGSDWKGTSSHWSLIHMLNRTRRLQGLRESGDDHATYRTREPWEQGQGLCVRCVRRRHKYARWC